MIRLIRHVFLLAILFVCIPACKDDPVDPTSQDCDDYIGAFSLLPTSIASIPYGGKAKAVFVDSLGHEISFVITSKDEPAVKGSTGNPVDYCFTTQHFTYTLTGDSLGIVIELGMIADPFRTDQVVVYVIDLFNITYRDPDPANISYGVFFKVIDFRDFLPIANNNTIYASITVLGRTFLDVEQTIYTNPHNWLLYNSTEGVVAFQDDSHITWRFERFE